MSEFKPIFSEANMGPEDAARVMQATALSASDLQDPTVIVKLGKVVSFFKQFEDGMSEINKVVLGVPPQAKLDFLVDYATAYEAKIGADKRIELLEKELKAEKDKKSSSDRILKKLRR